MPVPENIPIFPPLFTPLRGPLPSPSAHTDAPGDVDEFVDEDECEPDEIHHDADGAGGPGHVPDHGLGRLVSNLLTQNFDCEDDDDPPGASLDDDGDALSLLTSSSFFFISFSSFSSSPSDFLSSLLVSRDDDDETVSFCNFSLILIFPESRQFDEEEDDAEEIPKGRGQGSTGGSSWCGGPPLLPLMNRLGVGGGGACGAGGRGLPLLGVVEELLGLPEGCLVGTAVVVLPHPKLGSFDPGLCSVPMQLGHLVLGVGSWVSFDGFKCGGGGG